MAQSYLDHDNGVREVLHVDNYAAQHPGFVFALCEQCNRVWDDGIASGLTPAPSARCPFEYEH